MGEDLNKDIREMLDERARDELQAELDNIDLRKALAELNDGVDFTEDLNKYFDD